MTKHLISFAPVTFVEREDDDDSILRLYSSKPKPCRRCMDDHCHATPVHEEI